MFLYIFYTWWISVLLPKTYKRIVNVKTKVKLYWTRQYWYFELSVQELRALWKRYPRNLSCNSRRKLCFDIHDFMRIYCESTKIFQNAYPRFCFTFVFAVIEKLRRTPIPHPICVFNASLAEVRDTLIAFLFLHQIQLNWLLNIPTPLSVPHTCRCDSSSYSNMEDSRLHRKAIGALLNHGFTLYWWISDREYYPGFHSERINTLKDRRCWHE